MALVIKNEMCAEHSGSRKWKTKHEKGFHAKVEKFAIVSQVYTSWLIFFLSFDFKSLKKIFFFRFVEVISLIFFYFL